MRELPTSQIVSGSSASLPDRETTVFPHLPECEASV